MSELLTHGELALLEVELDRFQRTGDISGKLLKAIPMLIETSRHVVTVNERVTDMESLLDRLKDDTLELLEKMDPAPDPPPEGDPALL